MPPIAGDKSASTVIMQRIDSSLDLLRLHELNPERYPHLLQSATPGPQARYDILFAYPEASLILNADGKLQGISDTEQNDFLGALDDAWQRAKTSWNEKDAAKLPFRGGWFLYLGYELAGQVETRLRLPAPAYDVAIATRFRSAVILDHQNSSLWLITEPGTESRLRHLARDIAVVEAQAAPAECDLPPAQLAEESPERYLAMVRRALAYIREGDVFQANLARTWTAQFAEAVSPARLYRRLRRYNPGPFNGIATWPGRALISSSPERLVRLRGEEVDTRPIAGTRPRGQGADADTALSRELLAHPKERAEHIMLIDLERNDLGRICEPGSVCVDELMALESYAHVHHIVSNVRGRLRAGTKPGQVIRALFPGGTITGCPKVRCMEIIAELEGRARGAYTGSMGYLNRDGDLDLNILIRTLEQRGNNVELRAGAGIVADSDPEHELAETRAKARGLLRALDVD